MIVVTEAAIQHLNKKAQEDGAKVFRLFLKKRGCSGFEYRMDVTEVVNADDERYEYNDFALVVDKISLIKYFQGLVIDFQQTDFAQGLVFKNPNTTGSCGCGESVNFD